jgi:soluble lytic murein transglycosylase
MKKTRFNARVILLGLCFSVAVYSSSGKEYMERFQAYQQWNQSLPTPPTPDFLAFIQQQTPLAKKLREKWLFQMAYNKDWSAVAQYYQDSTNISLRCYYLQALFQQGKQQEALQSAKSLWLTGRSLPPACNQILENLVKSEYFEESLLNQRIVLALQNRNISLARYLLKQYKPPRTEEADTLTDIYLHPAHITELAPSELHGDFYLFGLKRLVNINTAEAIKLWQRPTTKRMLNEEQQQAFLITITLYKSIHNHEDASLWFAKIKPSFYNDGLLDLQIRHALKHQKWSYVEYLIRHFQDQQNPTWQYWLARSLEAQGKKPEAQELFQTLAQERNYYGFLASLRLNKSFTFDNEYPVTDLNNLKPYQPFTDQIKELYLSKQTLTAARLLNDFVLELPKDDKSALAYWLAHDLNWHSQSLFLCNNEELTNQLSLRFPLAHQETIRRNSQNYNIPRGLIYAIIRQESTFHNDIISPAGAHGLMQLMPSTAKVIAQREKIDYGDKTQLFSAQKNINIGTAYLKQLVKRFNHPVLVSAAYNAGPSRVVYWLKKHPPKQVDIWIETLPWQETRNYLKNIISFYAVYQYRMKEKTDLSEFMKPF